MYCALFKVCYSVWIAHKQHGKACFDVPLTCLQVLSVGRDHRDSGGLSLDVALVNIDGFGSLYDKLRRAAIKHKFQQPNCVQVCVWTVCACTDVSYK